MAEVVFYHLARGGCWPYSNGASHGGFTRIGPLAVAEGGIQPRMGADTNRPVPPNVLPFFDVFRYAQNDKGTPADPTDDTYESGSQGSNACFRIYAQLNGGPNTLIYALGNPYIGTWNGSLWDYVLDTASAHYVVSPAGWAAGWSYSQEQDGPAYGHLKPSDPTYATVSRRMQILKATPWDVGAWVISTYYEIHPSTGDASHGPETLEDSFTFTVAEEGGGSYDLEADIETTPGWCPSYVVGGSTPPNAAPVISNVTPAPGTPLAPTDHIALDATDDSGLFRRTVLKIEFWNGTTLLRRDMVWDGDTFDPLYAGSTCTAITGGFHFDLVRTAGWPAYPVSLSFTGYLFDQAGAENA